MSDRIVVNPDIHFGKPCVAGTRIPVQNVLELVREGLDAETIRLGYYPELSPDDVRACIQYAIEAELPDRGLLSIQPVSPDDDLINDLIAHDPAFRDLLARSLASPREPFPFDAPAEPQPPSG